MTSTARCMWAGVLAALLVHGAALAEEQTLQSQRWQTSMDAKGLPRTNSGALLGHLDFDVGIWGGYEQNPLVLRNPSVGYAPLVGESDTLNRFSPSRKRYAALLGKRFASEVTASLGLFKWVQLYAAIPVTLYQERGDGISGSPVRLEPVNQFNLGDVRLGGKVRILRADQQFVDLAFTPQFTVPVGLGFRAFELNSDPRRGPLVRPDLGISRWGQGYTSDGFFTFQPELALSREIFGFMGAVNGGLRLRRPYEVAKTTITQELLLRGGVGFKGKKLAGRIPQMRYVPIELALEAAFATSLNHPYFTIPYITPNAPKDRVVGRLPTFFQAYQHSLEVDASAGLDLFWVHPYAGLGVGLLPGYGTPDYRLYAGLRVSTDFGLDFPPKRAPPPDRDHDGIPDAEDACPDVAGVKELKGCPPPPPPPKAPGDQDGDGILDDVDQCPTQPEDKDGFEDSDGCPELDNDKDGITDDVDLCPFEPENRNGFEDADGCPDEEPPVLAALPPMPPGDLDKDGIADDVDVCPDRPEDFDKFEDSDGCPDPDNDRDGVVDGKDQCPLEAETINGIKDDDGCPDAGKTLVALKKERINILDKIYFETGKAVIDKRSFSLLEQVGGIIRANPELRINIEGHTDNKGNADYNKKLSQDRADAVRKFLIERGGVEADRLQAIGYGLTRPVAPNDTDKGREQNRRVEFVVVEGAQ